MDEYHDRVLAVLSDGRWHHAGELRFQPRWFDSMILTLVREMKSKGHRIDWRLDGAGDWYRLQPEETSTASVGWDPHKPLEEPSPQQPRLP